MNNIPHPDDHIVQRAVDELRRLPVVDPGAIRRVVRAAAEARVTPADEPIRVRSKGVRSIRLWTAIGLAAAAGVVGFVARGLVSPVQGPPVVLPQTAVAPITPSESARLVAVANTSAPDAMPILEQFVFENANARRVSVVGDFNDWNPEIAPMARSKDGAFWSAIIPIAPGRHMYGFMIDDSVFVLDPRAPTVRDPDLGTDGSVRMVGRGPGGQ